MRCVQKKKSNEDDGIKLLLVEVIDMANERLSAIEEVSIKEGNQNWKKSKLAVLFLNIKRVAMQILALKNNEPKEASAKASWMVKINKLLFSLLTMLKLADNEMQKQKEREMEKIKDGKSFNPIQIMLWRDLQKNR